MTGSKMTVEGCGSESLQGDVRFAQIMEQMGAKVTWKPHDIIIQGPQTLTFLTHDMPNEVAA